MEITSMCKTMLELDPDDLTNYDSSEVQAAF